MTGKPRLKERATFVTNLVVEELEFGKWQSWEEVLDRAIPKVPTGQALRAYQQTHEVAMRRVAARTVSRKINYSPALEHKDEKIRAGARKMLVSSFHRLLSTGMVESRLADPTNKKSKEVRLKDRRSPCPSCGYSVETEKSDPDA